MLYVYGLIAWLVFIPVPIVNGVLRENVLAPRVGAGHAHVISTLLLSTALMFGIAIFLSITADDECTLGLVALGVLWVGLTICFEFGFGHFVAQKPWAALLHDYNLAAGRIWSLVLLVELLAPPILG